MNRTYEDMSEQVGKISQYQIMAAKQHTPARRLYKALFITREVRGANTAADERITVHASTRLCASRSEIV